MIIGIAIPSLLAVLGAILTFMYINDIKHRQSFVQIADDMKENVYEIRRNEKNFLHYRNIDHIKSLKNSISSISELTDGISLETADQIGTKEINTLKESSQIYSGLVNELGTNFQNERKITDIVNTEGTKLENIAATKKLAKELSTIFILRLRLLEKNHMLLRTETTRLDLSRAISQITNVVPFCYDCSPYIDSVNNLISAYRQNDILATILQQTGDGADRRRYGRGLRNNIRARKR